MTRATVGGINSEDNLWYPLAVNSQGIAQIDTSGIPEPMQWKVKSWTPEYVSSDPEGSAIIDYGSNTHGVSYLLGNICFVKFLIETTNCTITNPRGSLQLIGVPYSWSYAYQTASFAGLSLGTAQYFRTTTFVVGGTGFGTALTFAFVKRTEQGEQPAVNFADLAEGQGTLNRIRGSYWGLLTSEVTPTREEAIAEMRAIAAENPTGTP